MCSPVSNTLGKVTGHSFGVGEWENKFVLDANPSGRFNYSENDLSNCDVSKLLSDFCHNDLRKQINVVVLRSRLDGRSFSDKAGRHCFVLIKIGTGIDDNYLSLEKFTSHVLAQKGVRDDLLEYANKDNRYGIHSIQECVLRDGHIVLRDFISYLHEWTGFYRKYTILQRQIANILLRTGSATSRETIIINEVLVRQLCYSMVYTICLSLRVLQKDRLVVM